MIVTGCLLVLNSCSLIKVSDIPDPFADHRGYGKIIIEIKIEGLKYTNEYVVDRSMASKVGQTYTKHSAELDRKRLSQLGIFTSIQFDVVASADDIILIVRVKEVSPYIPGPSFKITDENGLEIGASLNSPNLFGSASSLSTWIRFGGATNMGVRFKYPWYPGSGWWSGHQADYFHVERYNKIYQFNEKSDQLNLIWLPNIAHNLRLGPLLSYLSLASDQTDITLDTDNRDKIPGIGMSFQLDSRDLRTYPTKGWWSEILISYYGGNANYWQGNLDIRRYFRLGPAKNSLACYALTTITSGQVNTDIPKYLQFNIGGTNSVRGWNLGSREGKNQFLNTVEYWHLLFAPKAYQIWFIKQMLALQGAIFIDAGTAWNHSTDFSKNWIVGGGIGMRIITALGITLRLDVSIGQRGLRYGLNIGSNEKAVAQRDRIR